MSNRSIFQLMLVFLALFACTSAGCGLFGGKSIVIDKAIEAMEAKKAELLASNKEIADVTFRKDDAGDGIVIEYVYKEGVKFDESMDSEAAKTSLISQFKDNEGIRTVLEYGVYLKFVFKYADGTVITETKLEAADL